MVRYERPAGSASPKSQPLDRRVREEFGLSWDKARKAVLHGKVLVDGVVTVEGTRAVAATARVEYLPNAPRPHVAERIFLQDHAILHVDNAVLVVDKPAGISTIPFGDEDPSEARRTLDALLREVLAKRDKSRGRQGGRAPLGVVHRLDKETSGVMVFTRTLEAKKHLSQQFREHSVERRYLAIVHGRLDRALTLESYLLEDRGDGLRGSARGTTKGGQRAVTHVKPKRQLEGATLVECRLETGRTHQIRIHLSEAGHPLVGERVYIRNYPGPRIEASRMMLHAAALGFVHPVDEEPMAFDAAPPADFEARLAALEGSLTPPRAGPRT
jgi:23S rRNA pseudouridine1911/1915/1917 synthase